MTGINIKKNLVLFLIILVSICLTNCINNNDGKGDADVPETVLVTDTFLISDTTIILDTVIYMDTVIVTDTVLITDTLIMVDTLIILNGDTVYIIDTTLTNINDTNMNNYNFTQGGFDTTGSALDLAISGKGLFGLQNGDDIVFLRRPASFIKDVDGYLVTSFNDWRLQGLPLAETENERLTGTINSLPESPHISNLQDIKIPESLFYPPSATTSIKLSGNLDSDSRPLGSVHFSQSFLSAATSNDLLIGLKNENGQSLGIREGDVISYNATSAGVSISPPGTFIVLSTSTINELTDMAFDPVTGNIGMQVWIQANQSAGATVDIQPGGSIVFDPNGGPDIENFQVTSDNPLSTGFVTNAFALPTTISTSGLNPTGSTVTLLSPAEAGDLLVGLKDSEGNILGLEGDGTAGSDMITVQGEVGGQTAQVIAPQVYSDGIGVAPGTELQDLMDQVRETFKLPFTDGSDQENPTVSINPTGTDDNIPDGSIVLRGLPGEAFALDNISVRATNENQNNPNPTSFNSNFSFELSQTARDLDIQEPSISIVDDLGRAHDLTMTLTAMVQSTTWDWDVAVSGIAELTSGFSGTIIFARDGSVQSFLFDDSTSSFKFDPGSEGSPLDIILEAGGPGVFTGLTSFRSPSTAKLTSQNGFAGGLLNQITITPEGVINGLFLNNQSAELFRIVLADIPVQQGLRVISDRYFRETVYSGEPRYYFPGLNEKGILNSGALELDNK